MDLDAYLQRIGIPRRCAPDLAFLRRMHRAHLRTIPYENLDVLLGRELSVDGDRAFDKLVRGNRGGWCFEMNALFAGALEAAGYRVRTLAAVIKRDRWTVPKREYIRSFVLISTNPTWPMSALAMACASPFHFVLGCIDKEN